MKLNTVDRELVSHDGGTTGFTMKTSAKAFKIIMDGLYSDKAQSITREIFSNAYDAQVEVGNGDKPFDVTFPSSFYPEFKCRDYGTGLSPEFMRTRYTAVFDSTKEDSNSGIGKWGIGRLSPLSYTDTFNVTSYYNGKVYHWVVILGNDGAPELKLMGETDTIEPNGIMISFPIARNDVQKFRDAANRVSLGFEVKPNVLGDTTHEWPELPISVKGKNWWMIDTSGLPYEHPMKRRSGAWAKMGCVLYPINADGYTSSDGADILKAPVIIEFPIGSLEVTASREELSYGRNDPTDESIKAQIKAIITDMSKEYLEAINKCKTQWGVSRVLSGISYHVPASVRHKVYADCDTRTSFVLNGHVHKDLPRAKDTYYPVAMHRKIDTCQQDFIALRQRNTISWKGDSNGQFGFSADLIVYVMRDGKHKDHRDVRGATRIIQHFHQYVSKKNGNTGGSWNWAYKPDVLWIKYDPTDVDATKQKDTLLNFFDDKVIVIKVEDIPDPGAAPTNKRVVKLKQLVEADRASFYYTEKDMGGHAMERGGYIAYMSNNILEDIEYKWINENGNEETTTIFDDKLSSLWRDFKRLGLISWDEPLWIIPKTHWKKFQDQPQWKTVDTLVTKLLHDEVALKRLKVLSKYDIFAEADSWLYTVSKRKDVSISGPSAIMAAYLRRKSSINYREITPDRASSILASLRGPFAQKMQGGYGNSLRKQRRMLERFTNQVKRRYPAAIQLRNTDSALLNRYIMLENYYMENADE